jgi:DNA polymerase
MDLLNHENPVVAELVSARLGVRSTIEETRTKRLLGVADRGSLPVMLNYYGAHTGRLSGGDKINLQNLRRGGTLRKAIKAPPGHTLVAGDSAQIEARMLAWVSGQDDLLNAFRDGKDVYCDFASRIYGRTITRADVIERHVGKTCILGLGYGMGHDRFRQTLEIGLGGVKVVLDEAEARNIVHLYRSTYWRIARFWRRCADALAAMSHGDKTPLSDAVLHDELTTSTRGITLPNGLDIKYPLLRSAQLAGSRGAQWYYAGDNRVYRDVINAVSRNEEIPYHRMTPLHGGKVTENVIQALSRIVVTTQLLALSKKWPVVLQVHDENVLCVPDADVEEAKHDVRMIMSAPPHWAPTLPLACSVGAGKTYGDCK